MKTFTRPFTVSERKRLQQEVSWTPGMIVFGLMCAGLVLKLFQFLASKLAASHPFFKPIWWWLVPWALLVVFLVVRMETGKKGRRQNKADLQAGNALCHLVETVEAIAIEEQEDEGPGFFLRTAEGEILFMQGQYLDRYVMRQHFPWSRFEIVETPEQARVSEHGVAVSGQQRRDLALDRHDGVVSIRAGEQRDPLLEGHAVHEVSDSGWCGRRARHGARV